MNHEERMWQTIEAISEGSHAMGYEAGYRAGRRIGWLCMAGFAVGWVLADVIGHATGWWPW